MSQHITSLKPLFLNEEEAMALLNLCLTSAAETDTAKERAMLKLTDLVRRYIASEATEAAQPEMTSLVEPTAPTHALTQTATAGIADNTLNADKPSDSIAVSCVRPRGNTARLLNFLDENTLSIVLL